MNKQEKKKTAVWKHCIIFGFFVIIGAVCGLLIAKQPGITDLPSDKFFLVLGFEMICLFIAFFVQTIIHEAGHLLFGMLSGYSFSSFRIGNIIWVKNANKIDFKRIAIAGTGGQCLMNPPEMIDGKIPFFLYNLGGSLLNTISGLIFLVGYVLCKNTPLISALFIFLSIIGFAFAITNGIPIRLGAVNNDGYNAFSLRKSTVALRSFWVQLKINQEISKGARLRDIPEDWFFMPSDEEMKNSMTAVMGVLYANRLLDLHNLTEANALIDKLLSNETAIVDLHRSLLVCDKIYCKLLLQNDTGAIDEMLDKKQVQFMKQMKNYPSVLRTQYTVALFSENSNDNAKSILGQFEKCSKTHPYQGDVESELELIKKAEQIYEDKNNRKI